MKGPNIIMNKIIDFFIDNNFNEKNFMISN